MKKYLKVLGVGTMLFMAGCGDGEKKMQLRQRIKKLN